MHVISAFATPFFVGRYKAFLRIFILQQETHCPRILIGKLRQKHGGDASAPHWIATEPGVGLRFLMPTTTAL